MVEISECRHLGLPLACRRISTQVFNTGAVDIAYHDDGCGDVPVVQLPISGLGVVAGHGDCNGQCSADCQPELEAILYLPAGIGETSLHAPASDCKIMQIKYIVCIFRDPAPKYAF
jgi:hypothetical protein